MLNPVCNLNLEFNLVFTLPPEVKLGDYKSVRVKKVEIELVPEEKITQSILNIFEARKKDDATKEENVIYGADGKKLSGFRFTEPDDEFAKSLGARDLPHLKESNQTWRRLLCQKLRENLRQTCLKN